MLVSRHCSRVIHVVRSLLAVKEILQHSFSIIVRVYHSGQNDSHPKIVHISVGVSGGFFSAILFAF